jgi:thermitase
MNEKKNNKLRNYSILILLSAIIVAVVSVLTFNPPQERLINSREVDSLESKSIKDPAHHGADLLQKAQKGKPLIPSKTNSKIKNAIIGTTREFKIGGTNSIKGKVLDFYEESSKKAIRSRVTVIDTEEIKYSKLRIEETYESNALGQETILGTTTMVADHVIVKVQPHITPIELDQIASSYGFKVRKKMYSKNTYLIETPEASIDSVPDALVSLKNEIGLKIIDPDYLVHALAVPNDTNYPFQNSMNKIEAPKAWDLFTGSKDVIVAVIDSGVNYRHEDLKDNIWTNPGEIPGDGIDNDNNGFVDDIHGYDFADDDNDPIEEYIHGTPIAGIIGATGNNNLGVAGINWQVSIMALKFLNENGYGVTSDAVDSVEYAALQGASVTSNSWAPDIAVGEYYPDPNQRPGSKIVYDAIKGSSEVLFVTAAGNGGHDTNLVLTYPGSFTLPNIIAVAATNQDDNLASFSNYGRRFIHLAAPGREIHTTDDSGFGGLAKYRSSSGTSVAAPHVAGACALLKGYDSTLTAEQIKLLVLHTGDKLDSLKEKTITGRRLNVFNALTRAADSLVVFKRPFDGEKYLAASTVNISWTTVKEYGNLKIELLKDNVLHTIIADNTEDDGSFEWAIPNNVPVGEDYTVRISFRNNPTINDQSDIIIMTENFPKSPQTGWVQAPGSDASWSVASYLASQGIFSLKSDVISTGQRATIQYSGILKAGQVSFDRKVSSEDTDQLVFYIDGIEKDKWSGSHAWQNKTYNVAAGHHTFKWEHQTNTLPNNLPSVSWIDEVSFPEQQIGPVIDLTGPITGTAYRLGHIVNIRWRSYRQLNDHIKIELLKDDVLHTLITPDTEDDGVFDWVVPVDFPTGDYVLKVSAKETPSINERINITIADDNFPEDPFTGWTHVGYGTPFTIAFDQASEGSFSLKGSKAPLPALITRASINYTNTFKPGQISFYKKVSTEAGWDGLVFYIDGVHTTRWTGNNDWSRHTYQIPGGTHTFRWVYYKDRTVDELLDAVWIDDVKFPTINHPPVIEVAPTPQSLLFSDSIEFSVVASDLDDDILVYNWEKVSGPGDVNFESSSSSTTTATFTTEGTYEVKVTVNDGISFSSSNNIRIVVYEHIWPSGEGSNGLLRESWTGIQGDSVESLTQHPNFLL